MVKKKTETVVVTWRVKEALRRRLEAAAAHNEVSVNNDSVFQTERHRYSESYWRSRLRFRSCRSSSPIK